MLNVENDSASSYVRCKDSNAKTCVKLSIARPVQHQQTFTFWTGIHANILNSCPRHMLVTCVPVKEMYTVYTTKTKCMNISRDAK